MEPQIPQTVFDAAAAASAPNPARDAEFSAQFAPDYIDIKGVRFYRLKVAHQWALMRLGSLKLDPLDLSVVTAYMLMHDSESVRSELIPQLFSEPSALVLCAWQALSGSGVTLPELEPVLEQYAQDVEMLTPSKKLKVPGGQTPTGGPASSSASAKSSAGAKKRP